MRVRTERLINRAHTIASCVAVILNPKDPDTHQPLCLQPVSRPVAYAHAAAQPFVQVRGLGGDTPRCRSSPVLHRDSPTFVRQLLNTMLEVRERGIQPAQLAPREDEAEEHALVDSP